MIKIIYEIEHNKKEEEAEWLHEQKVFPAFSEAYDWNAKKAIWKVGAIVTDETALAIKLRHKLDYQQDYRQK
jgi:hypothetical protein